MTTDRSWPRHMACGNSRRCFSARNKEQWPLLAADAHQGNFWAADHRAAADKSDAAIAASPNHHRLNKWGRAAVRVGPFDKVVGARPTNRVIRSTKNSAVARGGMTWDVPASRRVSAPAMS